MKVKSVPFCQHWKKKSKHGKGEEVDDGLFFIFGSINVVFILMVLPFPLSLPLSLTLILLLKLRLLFVVFGMSTLISSVLLCSGNNLCPLQINFAML